ncbi:MAG TPA: TIGR02186 family protein [Pseudolabrys sp.]|nr:TIGR02186 family protein [Pseudolabrys sp.]
MIALLRPSLLGLAALALQAAPVTAEELVSTIAPELISISSSYSGSSVVAFGAIQADKPRAHPYDVIVTVSGPRQSVVTRRKERIAGVWLNKSSQTFTDIPSFLGVFANRPFEDIASAEALRKHRIGLERALFAESTADQSDPFMENLIKIRTEEKLYTEQPKGVTFLSPTAFRVDIPLPQSVLIGEYKVEFKVFSDGVPLVQRVSAFHVAKVGIEEFVIKAATDYSLLYGLATTMAALMMGWMASIIFRKD